MEYETALFLYGKLQEITKYATLKGFTPTDYVEFAYVLKDQLADEETIKASRRNRSMGR